MRPRVPAPSPATYCVGLCVSSRCRLMARGIRRHYACRRCFHSHHHTVLPAASHCRHGCGAHSCHHLSCVRSGYRYKDRVVPPRAIHKAPPRSAHRTPLLPFCHIRTGLVGKENNTKTSHNTAVRVHIRSMRRRLGCMALLPYRLQGFVANDICQLHRISLYRR